MDKQPDSEEISRSFKSGKELELIRSDGGEDPADPPDMINGMVFSVLSRYPKKTKVQLISTCISSSAT
jgi:hypothetical protein